MRHKIKLRKNIADFLSHFMSPKKNEGRLIILMYHAVTPFMEEDPDQLSISSELFAAQMAWLKQLKYLVMSLDKAVVLLRENRLHSPVVCLTFDDGYRSVYTHAFPILQKYDYPATVFLTTGVLGCSEQPPFMPHSLGVPMAWKEAREVHRHGIEFGAHSVTHRKLSHLSKKEIYEEVSVSKKVIEDQLSIRVKTFAYPYGSFDSFNNTSQDVLKECGYESVCTAIAGYNRFPKDLLRLKRSRISWVDNSVHELRKHCFGAYNWYAHYQRLQWPFQSLMNKWVDFRCKT